MPVYLSADEAFSLILPSFIISTLLSKRTTLNAKKMSAEPTNKSYLCIIFVIIIIIIIIRKRGIGEVK